MSKNHSGSTVEDQIYQFFRGKGLSDAQIYGILGNARIESSLRPGAVNGNEGAIGIFQWEGGRRDNLRAYAAKHGGKESDLAMQLGYAWHELTGGESGALAALKRTSTPEDAAAVWDAQYERSAGTTRQERISAAQQYASGRGYSGPSGYSGSSGAGSVGAGVQSSKLSAAQYQQALGSLAGIVTHVPELNKLLKSAVQSGQTADDFVNTIQNSKWYRTHSDTYRTMFSLQYSNPAEYGQQTKTTTDSVIAQARAMGVHLTKTQANQIAHNVLWAGYDTGATQRAIAGLYIKDGGVTGGTQSGNAATTTQQLQELAQAYGIPVTNTWLNNYTQKILAGVESTDGAKADLINQASSMYPSIAKQLKAGQTTTDVAQPYIAQMAQTLELPDQQLTVNDPTIKKALLYRTADAKTGKASNPTLQPLYQFQNDLRNDPRWNQTNNAKQEAYGMLHQLGQAFGFAS